MSPTTLSLSSPFDLVITLWSCLVALKIAAYYLDGYNLKRQEKLNKMNEEAQGSSEQQYFPQFEALNEDLMVNILSYVATVPFEVVHARPRSTVTGVLPLVCKQFNQFCKRDYFWQTSLKRLKVADPYLWEEGLLRLLPDGVKASENLVDQLHEALNIDYKSIFRNVLDTYIRITGPVFYMTGLVRIGHAFGLHFFEPRYRILIAEVMRNWPEEARQGAPIAADQNGLFPVFIYAHMAPLAPTTPACLVRVQSCNIHADGSADVMLVPVAYVWLERVWERRGAGRLCNATCIRMGRDQAREMEGANAPHGHAGFESDILRYLAQNGGLENPSHRAMHAILSYILNDRTVVVNGQEQNEDGEDDEDDDGAWEDSELDEDDEEDDVWEDVSEDDEDGEDEMSLVSDVVQRPTDA